MGHLGGVFNNYRIPFQQSVRVTVHATTDTPRKQAWWVIRGTENLPVMVGGVRLPSNARLKLYRLERYAAKPLEEFTLCDINGAGALYQVAMAVQGERKYHSWEDQSYQEGCVRAYMARSRKPTFLSSGLEDYFLGAGYFHQGKLYYTPVAGLTHIDREANCFSAYRFHDEDPVFFQDGFRLTCRCGEELNGKVFHHPVAATYTVYVWVYQW
jgi:hypothetical protein